MTIKKNIQIFCVTLFAFLSVTAQKQTSSKKYRLLTYGLPDDTRQNARNIIKNKWNIEFYSITGCIVDDKLEDSVEKENDKTEKLIEVEYGKDWEKKFYAEVENEYKIEAQIDSLVKEQKFIQDKEIINPLPGAPFPMHPIDSNGNYIVIISTYNRQWEEQKLYKLQVNYIKKSIKIVNDYTAKK